MDDTIDSIYMINDVRMHSLHDMVVRASTNGVFEPETFKHWTSRTTGGIAIDVGSYTGVYCIAAALNGASSYAFEPNPKVYDRLLANIMLNLTSVKSFNVAISDRCGSTSFHAKPMHLTSAGSIDEDGEETVNTALLDSFFGKPCKISAIKIDVEGHELNAIRGAKTIIERSHPLVIAEFNGKMEDHDLLVAAMERHGYSNWEVCDRRNLVFID